MIDSHCHISMCEDSPERLIASARECGVEKLLTVGVDLDSSWAAVKLAEQFSEVYAAVGIHPNSAAAYTPQVGEELTELAAHPRCVAIGETGLDYYREGAAPTLQHESLRAHIALARSVDKPLIVHTRAADADTLMVLTSEATDIRVLIHCFSLVGHIQVCCEQGWWISFAGNVTYPSAEDLRTAVPQVPANRLLVETDAPFLSPQPQRGKPNRPEYVTHTAARVADLRNITYEELEQQVTSNANELFRWT